MAITSGDIAIMYSVKTGSAGNSTSSTGPNSLGKYISTTAQGSTLFDDISAAENAASTVDYRCCFLINNHATLTLKSAGVYVSSDTSGGAVIALAIDNIAASAKGASSAQAAEIANKTTAPSGVGSFSSPTTAGTALSLGDIPAGSCRAFWVRRTAANTAAISETAVIGWVGETDA